MKVLIDSRNDSPYGIGRYVSELTTALARLQRADNDSIVLLTHELRSNLVIPQEVISEWFPYSLDELETLSKVSERVQSSVIHCTDYRIPLTYLKSAVVVSIHDIHRYYNEDYCYDDKSFIRKYSAGLLEDLKYVEKIVRTNLPSPKRQSPVSSNHGKYYAAMLWWAIYRADVILTPTQVVRDQIVDTFDVRCPIEIIPYGVDHEAWGPRAHFEDSRANESVNLDLERSYFLYVGHDRPHKNVRLLLEAFRQCALVDLRPSLILVGADFENNDYVKWFVKTHSLSARTRIIGQVSDSTLMRLYEHAAALIHLASDEGFGFTPLEAASLGTNVVVADAPVFHETLGPSTRFVNQFDTEAVTDAMLDMLRSSTISSEVRAKASSYQWTFTAAETYKAYLMADLVFRRRAR